MRKSVAFVPRGCFYDGLMAMEQSSLSIPIVLRVSGSVVHSFFWWSSSKFSARIIVLESTLVSIEVQVVSLLR